MGMEYSLSIGISEGIAALNTISTPDWNIPATVSDTLMEISRIGKVKATDLEIIEKDPQIFMTSLPTTGRPAFLRVLCLFVWARPGNAQGLLLAMKCGAGWVQHFARHLTSCTISLA